MASISSPGIGSGLDVTGIVSKLMAIESQPLQALDKKEASYQAQLSAFGSLKGTLSALQSSLTALGSASAFNTMKTSVSDSTVFSASAGTNATSGSYSVEVKTLAQAQKLSSTTFANTSAPVGTGSITIQFGTYDSVNNTFTVNPDKSSTSITINPNSNSLTGIRDAINSAKAGVTASIVNDGTGNRLVISSNDTGQANSMKITVSDADGANGDANGLSQLAYDPTTAAGAGKNMTQTMAAQNATATIDGMFITKASNTITDAIQGVTLNLTKAVPGTTNTLTVSQDTTAAQTAIQGFVKAYNDAINALKQASAYNADTKTAAILQGDATVRTITTQLQNAVSSPLSTSAGGFQRLSDVGISVQRDGTLQIDNTKLTAAFNDPNNDITGLFASLGKTSDSLISFSSSNNKATPGTYNINITQIASQGKLTPSAAPSTLTIDNTNQNLTVAVDGTSASIALTAGKYTLQQLASELQSKINGSTTLSKAGSSVTVSVDGTQGKVAGSAAAGLTYNPGDPLQISVDGNTQSIDLTDGTNPATFANVGDLANSLQTKLNTAFGNNKVLVSVSNGAISLTSTSVGTTSQVSVNSTDGNGNTSANASTLFGTAVSTNGTGTGGLLVTSNKYGSASNVTISGDGASALFGASRTNTAGTDVQGTIGGYPASGSGQALTGGPGPAEGLKINVTGGQTGDRGTITYDRGFAFQLNQLLDSVIGTSGTLQARTDGINSTIKSIDDQRTTLSTRLTALQAQYMARYTALDTLMSQMTQTSSYLTQQLASIKASS